MAKLILVRATKPDGVWKRLRVSWKKQLKKHGASLDWAEPSLNHATEIIESRGHDDYGIFVVCSGTQKKPRAPYVGFIHISFKLVGTSKGEIKLIWNRIAPKYQFEDLKYEVADILATFLFDALRMSEKKYKKIPIKMFLGNPIELAFGRNFALFINKMPATSVKALVRSNWLYLHWK